jgi:putative ABC transport system permease protein
MNVLRLAAAYATRRPLATVLNVLLLAVGVATMAAVILASHALEDKLAREAAGIDLVVGAKGSPLQLVLAGVYHADVPPGNVPLSAVEDLRHNPLIRRVVPLALGDSHRGFRIVGTEDTLLTHYGAKLARGTTWTAPMEAVVGSEVARATRLDVGATFAGSHGMESGGGEHESAPYRVVGVLAPTHRVVDRLILTGVASVWEVHEHHAAEGEGDKHEHEQEREREVTLALVQFASPLAAASLPRAINAETVMQAASPAYESARLFTIFGVGVDVIRGFALLLVASAAVGLFVALTQALDERRYDIAIMRALGAPRGTVVAVLMVESLLLVATGLLAGLALAHGLAATVGTWLPAAAAHLAGAWVWQPEEWGIVGLALGAGIIATLLPAWRAYRLDVAAILADH